MDIVRRSKAAATDPRAARPAVPSAAPQPPAASPSHPAPPARPRVGLFSWLAGHSVRLIFRALTATIILDRPSAIRTTDPAENARMRKVSAAFWGIVVPIMTLLLAGPLAAAAAGVVGWFLLVRHRAGRQSIPVTPASLVDDLRTTVKHNRSWRTVGIAIAVLAAAGVATSLFLLSVGQLLLAAAWLLSLALGYAAAVSGIEQLEQIDLGTGLERGVLALGAATNRAVEKLRGKAGTDVAR